MPQPAPHWRGRLCMGSLSPPSAPGCGAVPLTGTTFMSTHSFWHLLPFLKGFSVFRVELGQLHLSPEPHQGLYCKWSVRTQGQLHYELYHGWQGQLSRLWRVLGPVNEVFPDCGKVSLCTLVTAEDTRVATGLMATKKVLGWQADRH